MTWHQVLILFIVYLICAAPFVRIMLKWDKNNDFRENETKINLMLRFFSPLHRFLPIPVLVAEVRKYLWQLFCNKGVIAWWTLLYGSSHAQFFGLLLHGIRGAKLWPYPPKAGILKILERLPVCISLFSLL